MTAVQTLLTPSDGRSGDEFGFSIAMSDDGSVIVVAGPNAHSGLLKPGHVYVYSGPDWATETILVPSDAVNLEFFGSGVAISGDGSVIVVGAYYGKTAGVAKGKVYVYTGPDWATESTLVASDGGDGYGFGSSVGISGDGSAILVGSPNFPPNSRGKAYLYTGPGYATETMLNPSTPTNYEAYGKSVALSEDATVLVVGTSASAVGRAYVYSGSGHTTETILSQPGGANFTFFGTAVSVSGDGTKVAVGAYYAPVFAGDGRVYVYEGPPYVLTQTLETANLCETFDQMRFGESVAFSRDGETLVVGVTGSDGGWRVGAIAVYTSDFSVVTRVAPPSGELDEFYGISVAASANGRTLAVGASQEWGGKGVAYGVDFKPRVVIPSRFIETPPWRFIVTRLDGSLLTFLDGRAFNRQVVYTLNDTWYATMDVPSDDPEINLPDAEIASGFGDPFVSMGNRLIFGFRREGTDCFSPWKLRFSGILMQPNDEITPGSDAPITHITAFDPWAYLMSRPVLTDAGLLPDSHGFVIDPATTADQAIIKLLVNAIAGGPAGGPPGPAACFIDYVSGTIETLDPIGDVGRFPQGTSVGEAWQQIVKAGLGDIMLMPRFNPNDGYISTLNIYRLAGGVRPEAVFSWDKPGRSLVGLNRLQDGQKIMNVPQYYAGQAGTPVPRPTSATGNASIAKYGPYWAQKFFSGANSATLLVQALALAALELQALGKRTETMDPAPEMSPRLFDEYFLGDQCPMYASRNFRDPIAPRLTSAGWQDLRRIYQIPVSIPDDAPENVGTLLLASPFEE